MSEWPWLSIREITEAVNYGIPENRRVPKSTENATIIPTVHITNMMPNGRVAGTFEKIAYRTARRRLRRTEKDDPFSSFRLRVGDVLITNHGTRMKVAVVDEATATQNTVAAYSITVLAPKPLVVSGEFLAYMLASPRGMRILEKNAPRNKKTKMFSITPAGMEDILVPVPPLDVQMEAVGVIRKVDDTFEEAIKQATRTRHRWIGMITANVFGEGAKKA